jgi:dTDP-4-dehydrorhamnose reductase
MFEPMKVLVTGSNGLLGQKLTDLYRQRRDVELIATAKGKDRYARKEGYVYEEMDITSRQNVEAVIREHQPQVVINTAAMTNVDACETDHDGCDALNVSAVQYLADACNAVAAHFIHISTDFIFDGSHGPLDESEKPAPLSYYGHSKLKGEEIVKLHSMSWAILRTVLVYGVVSDMSRSNVVLWVKGNLEQGKKINVVDDQFRTPTLAEDLAMACMHAADKRATGIYHVSGPDYMNIYELAGIVADHWGLDRTLISRASSAGISQPAKRPPVTGFIIAKAKRELGYEPRSIREGLSIVNDQLNAQKNNA